jgi:hypothetical protein
VPVPIASFAAIRVWLKRLVLRVHPDVLAHLQGDGGDGGDGAGGGGSAVDGVVVGGGGIGGSIGGGSGGALAQNEAALAELFRVTGLLAQRCGADEGDAAVAARGGGGGGGADDGAAVLPAGRLELVFFRAAEAGEGGGGEGGGGSGLRRCSVTLAWPPAEEERLRVLARRGFAAQARARWLELAAEAVGRLCAAARVPAFPRNGALVLAPELAALAASVAPAPPPRAAGAGGESGEDADVDALGGLEDAVAAGELLRERARARRRSGGGGGSGGSSEGDVANAFLFANLAAHSPLAQGKARAFPVRGVATAGVSVFSPAARRARAEALLARPAPLFTVASPPALGARAAAAAVRRLRACMVAHFDALALYHPLWSRVRLRLGPAAGADAGRDGSGSGDGDGAAYRADAEACAFEVPADFDEARLVGLVERAFPGLVAAARAALPEQARERARERERERAEREREREKAGGGLR